MTKKQTEQREAIDLRRRVVELETEALSYAEKESRWALERVTLQREVAASKRQADNLRERLSWVRDLTDGSEKNPLDLNTGGLQRGRGQNR